MSNANRPNPVVKHNARRIIIAAASARALAASSVGAGYAVTTIDLFADADTISLCRKSNRHILPDQSQNFAWQCDSMGEIFERLEALVREQDFQYEAGPPIVLIGGGLERCFESRCFGNDNIGRMLLEQNPHQGFFNVMRWRDIDDSCRRNSIAFPTSTCNLSFQQDDTRWLVKTELSSGGLGVVFAQPKTILESDQYFQKYIDGRSISACYVAAPTAEGQEFPFAVMLGVCEPISILPPRTHDQPPGQPLPFRYQGSIGPINFSLLPATVLAELTRVGRLLAVDFGLVGIFGIDFILNQDGLWLLEVNPRIPASAELIEYAARRTLPEFSIVQLHIDALRGKTERMFCPIEACQIASTENHVFAKKIVYRHREATEKLRITQTFINELESRFGHLIGEHQVPPAVGAAFVTDVPKLESEVGADQPLLTIHVSGESNVEVRAVLRQAFDWLEGIFNEELT